MLACLPFLPKWEQLQRAFSARRGVGGPAVSRQVKRARERAEKKDDKDERK
jgi:hypothetical protein